MSFLGKMVAKAVGKKIERAAVEGVVNHMENTRSVDALINKSTANYMLFIKKKSMTIKRGFIVYDEFNNEKYVIKTDALSFGYPCIRLYDTEDNEIGRVDLSSNTRTTTYEVFLDGRQLGTLIRKASVNIKLDVNFNGWHLDGNFLQNNFIVTDRNDNEVIKFNTAFSSHDTYVLEMNNREHEILGLLLVMAVELIIHGND